METLTVSASPAAPSRTRLAGWLLALQLIGWVGAIVAGLANFPPSEFDTWTPATFASVQAPWILFHLFIALAIVIGNSGLALLATRLRTSRARLLGLVTLVCAIGAMALIVVVAALRVSVVGFTAPTLGQVRAYQVSDPLFRSADAITLLATLSAAIGLWQSGLARRTGLVVAILCGLLLVLSFLGDLPPFVVGLAWLAIGVALLVGRRRA
ncbi:MAG: hypothetical protein ACJ8CR_26630 [Roseiflexaceae bacterium]